VKRLKPKLGSSSDQIDYDYVDNNLVKLHVFFKETLRKDFTESPSYPVSLMPKM